MMRLARFLIFSLLLTGGAAAQISESNFATYLEDLYQNRNSRITDRMISEFNDYFYSFHNGANADRMMFLLGRIYMEEEMYREAFVTFLKIKYLYPQTRYLVDVTGNMNQIVLTKAERLFEDHQSEIIGHITAPLSEGDYQRSYFACLSYLHQLNLEDLNIALLKEIRLYLSYYPDNAIKAEDLIFWSGNIYESIDEWYEALVQYRKLMNLFPSSVFIPNALYRIAWIHYKETDQYELARDTFIKLVTDYSQLELAGDAQFYLAELFQNEIENETEAIANYRLLVETYPQNAHAVEALKRVAEMLEDQKNFEEAIAGYYQIFELYPDDEFAPEALMEIERLYRKELDNYEKSAETLKLYAERYPKLENAAENLYDAAEMVEEELNNKQGAIDLYHQVINNFPNSKYAEKARDQIEDLTAEQ